MKEYLFGIIGIILITLILEIVLSDGKLKTYVKSLYSIILILVILSTIIKLKKVDFKFDFFSEDEIVYDEAFLDFSIDEKMEYYKKCIDKILCSIDVKNAGVVFEKEILDYQRNLKKIIIYLEKASINNVDEHINITKKIKDSINNNQLFNGIEVLVYE